MLPWLGLNQYGDLARDMSFQKGQIVCSFARVNQIKLRATL